MDSIIESGVQPKSAESTPRVYRENNPLVVVTGVSGSGKDRLIEEFRERSNMDVDVVNFGEELFERLRLQLPDLSSRDEIAYSVPQNELYPIIRELVSDIRERGPAILNTHVVYRHGGGLTANPAVEQQVNPDAYFFVQADAAQIVAWRRKDEFRERQQEEERDIALHQDIARAVTGYLAEYVNARFLVIENSSDNIDRNWRLLEENIEACP